MKFNCFRRVSDHELTLEEAPRRVSSGTIKRGIRRTGTDLSISSRTSSNASIAKLPPCRGSNPVIEAMMMPVPPEPRPSRCLRLSQPKTYSNIVTSMKETRGTRDWRAFDVFPTDDTDDFISADEVARERAADCEKKVQKFARISSATN
jgi:hypothetical protein